MSQRRPPCLRIRRQSCNIRSYSSTDVYKRQTYDNIMMVEGEMQEVSEQDLLAAMKAAHEAIKVHCKAQMELMEEDVYKRQGYHWQRTFRAKRLYH